MRVVPRVLAAGHRRYRSCLTRDELDDLAQSTFATIWRRLATYRGEAPFESFAGQIAIYHLLNASRKKRATLLGENDVLLPATPSAGIDTFERQLLRDAVAQLDDSQAQVIELKLYHGLTFEEIERQLGVSSNTLKTRYYRGLDQLRSLLRGRSLERPA
ncbi:MAG: sigma-70 family RNA polymerase sigma factor [Planctomycetes bacterium]|nr:sigma-70 family RNA polymerase sigma factor [Planctomycetota bacterium]